LPSSCQPFSAWAGAAAVPRRQTQNPPAAWQAVRLLAPSNRLREGASADERGWEGRAEMKAGRAHEHSQGRRDGGKRELQRLTRHATV